MKKLVLFVLILSVLISQLSAISLNVGDDNFWSENALMEEQHDLVDESTEAWKHESLNEDEMLDENSSSQDIIVLVTPLSLLVSKRPVSDVTVIYTATDKYSGTNLSGVCTIDCFVAGTQVFTPTGYRSIETMELGDDVFVYNLKTGNLIERKLSDRKTNFVASTYQVIVDGEVFQVTGDHEFYIDDQGWVEVSDLQIGMQVLSSEGTREVQNIVLINEEVTVYNIAAPSMHENYMVGNSKIVVRQ